MYTIKNYNSKPRFLCYPVLESYNLSVVLSLRFSLTFPTAPPSWS